MAILEDGGDPVKNSAAVRLLALSAAAMAFPLMSRADDLAGPRAILAAEVRLFASYDAKLAPRVYAPDVIWQNPFGVRLRGASAVERFLQRLFARRGYRSGEDVSAPVVTDLRLATPGLAVAWSEETSQGQVEDGKPLGTRKSHYLEVLRRLPMGWRITDEMIMDER